MKSHPCVNFRADLWLSITHRRATHHPTALGIKMRLANFWGASATGIAGAVITSAAVIAGAGEEFSAKLEGWCTS